MKQHWETAICKKKREPEAEYCIPEKEVLENVLAKEHAATIQRLEEDKETKKSQWIRIELETTV